MDGHLFQTSAWKNSVNVVIRSAGMFLSPRTLKPLNSTENIQLRVMVATFNGNHSTIIISCHSPTNLASDETVQISFYNDLFSLVHSIPKSSNHR